MDIGEKWRPNLIDLNNGGRGNGVGNNNNTNLIYNLEYIQELQFNYQIKIQSENP